MATTEPSTLAAAPPAVDAAAAVATTKRVAKKLKKGAKAAADVKPKGSDDGADNDEENANNIATVDHPYLSFLHKRIRLYKKKLEKIRTLEAAKVVDGKVLNEQQRELVGSKSAMEKIVTEFESLREQFIEVYLQEEAAKKAEQEKLAVAAAAAAVKAAKATEAAVVAEPTAPETASVAESSVSAIAIAPEVAADAFAHVQDLLKTLHVVNLHQALGKEIPMVLDFFSKVLLGSTRPVAEVSFEENLAESLAEAKKYLQRSDKVMACDSTYSDLREIVDALAQMNVLAEVVEATGDEEQDDDNAAQEGGKGEDDASDKLPEINFFTDSLLDSGDADDAFVLDDSTDDKADEHANAPEEIEEAVEEQLQAQAVTIVATSVVVETAPSPSSIPAPPMSFAAAAASTPANAAPLSAWGNREKVVQAVASSSGAADVTDSQNGPRRPRVQGGRGKSGTVTTTTTTTSSSYSSSNGEGDKQRRPRPQRSTDEGFAPRSHNARPAPGPKEDRRPRVDRALRKQGSNIHQPHAHASPQA
ncbi:hypothetical protein PybrP1_007608 [[Pythium] brassicae (nom. inval.)]|nr:hypothetical protein PybrP1_007608 [[Pythium] brassicae (nom. inval.)]